MKINLMFCAHCGKDIDVDREIFYVYGKFPACFTVCASCYKELDKSVKRKYRKGDLRKHEYSNV